MAGKKKSSTQPDAAMQAATLKRFERAQAACHAVISAFDGFETDGGFEAREPAYKYAQMCRVYAKKLRNSKVLSSADFDIAVGLCTAARRALHLLDPELVFAGLPQAEALQTMAPLAYGVLDDNFKLGGPNSKRPRPF
ncbi:hypothetical protein EGI20_06380 [Aquitalea sp. S1-19]|nr:hypothetical protein [Aquitalea sp. S1-19]